MVEYSFLAVGLLLGTVLGGFVVWFLTGDRIPPSFRKRLEDAEKGAVAVESRDAELRARLQEKGKELESLRSKLESEQKARTAAESKLQSEREKLQEEKDTLKEARTRLSEAFQALAAQALESNNQAFLQLATQTFKTVHQEGQGDLKQRKTEIEALVNPLAKALEKYETGLQVIEGERQRAYGDLRQVLEGVKGTQELLRSEASNLVSALRRPHVRSRWGELTLRRVVELAGMAEHCDFSEKPTIAGEDGRYQPDMVVHMPGKLSVPVDAKVPLDAYLDAVAASREEERNAYLVHHGRQVRAHMEQLSSKEYWDQFEKAPEVTVLFLPGEPFFSAAVERDVALFEDAIRNHVLIATPVTLLALLKAVAYGWRQEDIAQNARKISEAGKQVYERFSTVWDHLGSLRSALGQAVDAFNKTLGSIEARLLPSVRKLRELGSTSAEEIPEMEPIDRAPRSLAAPPDHEESERG